MQSENLKNLLLANVLLEEPSKLQVNIKELLEKVPFMKLIKNGSAIEFGAKETKQQS